MKSISDQMREYVSKTMQTKQIFNPEHEAIWNSITTNTTLASLITEEDKFKINKILKLPSNNSVKVNRISEILRNKGLFIIGVGTNRCVYQSINDPTITLKIALDNIGRRDSPREYINQELLKPFCVKIFEVSPCGTYALTEAVTPIKSKESFSMVFDEVLNLLLGYIAGRYAMDDIGFENFMNYGIRKGFGPVLLDYPYVYKMKDIRLCTHENSDGTKCYGKVDYEAGFMDFVCSKCNARYTALEIGDKIYDLDELMRDKDEVKRRMDDSKYRNKLEYHEFPDVKIIRNGRVEFDSKYDCDRYDYSRIRSVPYQLK